MHPGERVQLGLSILIRISIAIGIITAIFEQNWLIVFVASLCFILTFLPALIEKNYKVYLPIELEFFIVLFLYGSMYLGEVHSYYTRFWWWDSVLHGTSAVMLGIAGFILVHTLNRESRVKINMSPFFVALFAFVFAVAMGALWEIFEFAMDSWFGLNMQKSGLVDTMWDLIVDSGGALLASLGGYFYMKKGELFIFDKPIKRFVDSNKPLFRRQ